MQESILKWNDVKEKERGGERQRKGGGKKPGVTLFGSAQASWENGDPTYFLRYVRKERQWNSWLTHQERMGVQGLVAQES